MSKKEAKPKLTTNPGEALAELETPQVKWKVMLQIVGALAVLWVTSFIAVPWLGYWGVGVVGVITVLAAGFLVYIYRMTTKSRQIVDIMKGATDAEGRQQALDQLAGAGGKDAMKALARAQLLAQSDPQAAQAALEAIDLKKAPAVVQDDVRSQLAMLYLRNNRTREARTLIDDIRLDRQPNAKAKGLYAAIMAEGLARTGGAEEARKLLETYPPAEADSVDNRAMLLRAQVYTCVALKKRGLAKTAMAELAAIEPNLLGGFLQKGSSPELMKLAKQVAASVGLMKMKVKRTP
ncbi:MAG: tetratricopeptide repeat protein [Myxococcales bacterium]|nr:tetratricopeptide repeat protein [Myxococcales bacterium]MDD9969874.1 tetratricopeptide repeat protein [Myxococcales bacterium]